MSSLVGHSLAAVAAYGAVKKPARLPVGLKGVAMAVGLALLPDLDVLLRIALPSMFNHRGFTHSLVFAAGVSLLLALIMKARRARELIPAWLGLFLAAACHPVLDWAMGVGPRVPFLWPWVEQGWLSPVQWVPTAYYSSSLRGLAGLITHPASLRGVGLELVMFLPWVALVYWLPRMRRGSNKFIWGMVLLGASAYGFYLTLTLYGGMADLRALLR